MSTIVSRISPTQKFDPTEEEFESMDTVTTTTTAKSWYSSVTINGLELRFKLDTGAEVTAISEDDYARMGKPKLVPATNTLCGPSQQRLETKGHEHSAGKMLRSNKRSSSSQGSKPTYLVYR